MPKSHSRRFTTASTLVCALVLGGACGGDGDSDKKLRQTIDEFVDKYEAVLLTEVVRQAYDQDRLGTKEEVEADMEPFFGPHDTFPRVPAVFDDQGEIIPITEMSDSQAYAFQEWYQNGERIREVIGRELSAVDDTLLRMSGGNLYDLMEEPKGKG